MADIAALTAANEKRWENARLTRSLTSIARQLVALRAKAKYQAVSARTGVPWALIAVFTSGNVLRTGPAVLRRAMPGAGYRYMSPLAVVLSSLGRMPQSMRL